MNVRARACACVWVCAYVCVCLRACVRDHARVRDHTRVGEHVRVRVHVRVHVRARVRVRGGTARVTKVLAYVRYLQFQGEFLFSSFYMYLYQKGPPTVVTRTGTMVRPVPTCTGTGTCCSSILQENL